MLYKINFFAFLAINVISSYVFKNKLIFINKKIIGSLPTGVENNSKIGSLTSDDIVNKSQTDEKVNLEKAVFRCQSDATRK